MDRNISQEQISLGAAQASAQEMGTENRRFILPEESGGYMDQRLNGQFNYYHNVCKKLKREHNWLSILNMIFISAIPIFSMAVDDWATAKYIVTCLSAAGTVLSGILLLHKPQKKQLLLRGTYEALKTERIYYLNEVKDYKNRSPEEKAEHFIIKCEELMENEHTLWKKYSNDKSRNNS